MGCMAGFSKGGRVGVEDFLKAEKHGGYNHIFSRAKRSKISRYSWKRRPRVLQNQKNGKPETET